MFKKKTNLIDHSQQIFLITGPGHHDLTLREALFSSFNKPVVYTQYWPQWSTYLYKGESELVHTSFFYGFLNKVVLGLAARMPFLKRNNFHLYLSYLCYDAYARSRYSNQGILWSWAQTSLSTMRKAKKNHAKIIHEYPMIHPLEWKNVLTKALGEKGYQQSNAFINKLIERRSIKEFEFAHKINVLSRYAFNTFVANKVAMDKLVVSTLYVDQTLFKPSIDIKPRGNRLELLFVGRVEYLKGIAQLCRVLQNSHLDYHLTLVGTVYPEVESDLEQIASHTTLIGAVDKAELPAFYQRHDVLILPSLQESFGLVMAEALSCGIPVIASQNTGALDLIDHKVNGFIFDPFNDDQLMEGLRFYYDAVVLNKAENSDFGVKNSLLKSSKVLYHYQIKSIINE